MASGTNFKTYDPVAQLIAAGSGGGGGLPTTGGTLTGNLNMQVPAKVVQCQPPTGPCDLTNKTYVDSLIGGGPFLPLAGGIMTGAISQSLTPVAANDVANKAYVDAQVSGVTVPDATTTVKGKIQLTGDLSGTAAAPLVAPLAITNSKLANLTSTSQLKGSSSASSAATDITLGAGLSMTGSTLSVNPTTIPKAGNTQFGVIEFDPSGDLSESSVNSGIGLIKPLAVTNAKLANLNATSQLKGSSSASSATTDISLGSGLNMVGSTLSVDVTTIPKAGTTQFGVVEFDPSGDLNATAVNSGIGVIKPLAVTNAKLANLTSVSQLKGSGSGSAAATDITLGNGLSMTGTSLNVDTTTLPVIPVSKGGTGATTLTGYLKGTGTTPITSVATIPTTDLSGQFVGSVNGVAPIPTNGGNVTVLMGNVTTGTLAALPAQPQPNGNIYVVSGDPTPSNNGRTFISDGTNWREVTSNLAATDARYILKAGDTMTGNLNMPSPLRVILADQPTTPNEAANKAYVDAQIVGGAVPDATPVIKGKIQLAGDFDPTSTAAVPVIKSATVGVAGKIQLAGDLAGTSVTPVVAPLAITNAKLANLSATSQLKGSSSASSTATDITLGNGLTMTASTLSVDATTIPKAGNTQFGVVEFDPSGDLAQTAANSGIGVVKPLAITNAKLANLSATSQLKGSSSASSTATDITLGSGLSMTGTTLSVNPTTIQKAGAAQFGVVEFDSTVGDLTDVGVNSGIALVKNMAITNAKLANLSATSQLKGSSSASSTATDITLGSGLSMTGSTLSVNPVTLSKAGNTQFGVVEFDPTGDLTQTSANSGIGVVGPNKITYAKIQQEAPSAIMGTPSSGSNPGNYQALSLGSSMSLTGPNGTPATGSVLNSALSFVAGPDPNSTAPTDRPATSNIAYIGNNGSLWVWNGSSYVNSSSLGVQQYKFTTSNIVVPSAVFTPVAIPELTIPIPNGQRMRMRYIMRCQTTNGSYAVNFQFPARGSMPFTGMAYSANNKADTINQNLWCSDITETNGFTSSVSQPDWNTSNDPRSYFIDADVLNNSGSLVNWTISAVLSDVNAGVTRSVLLNSSVAYTFF